MGGDSNRRTTSGSSVLAQLRALVPRRPLRYAEALRIAELQAQHLVQVAERKEPPMTTDVLRLPRIQIDAVDDGPVPGSAHWNGHTWVIVIDARQRQAWRRFSLAHEFKHIIDHSTHSFLYTGMPGMTAGEQAERAADYFAGCLLVPRRWLTRICAKRDRKPSDIGRLFAVPTPIANIRLSQCGLAPRPGTTSRYPRRQIRCQDGERRGPR